MGAESFEDGLLVGIDAGRLAVAAKRLGANVTLITLQNLPAAHTGSTHTEPFRRLPEYLGTIDAAAVTTLANQVLPADTYIEVVVRPA